MSVRSARQNSLQRSQSSSRKTPAFSCKSGVTMMTQMSCEVEADVFREGYIRIQSNIEAMKVQRDDLLKWIREGQIKLATMQKINASKEEQLNKIEAGLDKRQRQLDQHSSIQIEKEKQVEALAVQKSTAGWIEALKEQLDHTHEELGRTLTQVVRGNALENQIRLLKTVIAGLTKSVQERSQIVMACEQQLVPVSAKYQAAVQEEEKWLAAKAEKNARIDELEEKRSEFVRILAEPIDTNEYEEQVAQAAEEDLAQTEKKLEETEAEKVEDEVTEQEVGIERMEQENKKKAVMHEKRTEALEKRRIFMEWRSLCTASQLMQQREEIMQLVEANNEKWRTVRLHEEGEVEVLTPELCAEKLSKLMQDKQKNLEQLNNANHEYEQKLKASRTTVKNKWERKMRRIENYSKRVAKKDAIRLQIEEKVDGNEELRQKSRTLEHKIDQMKKRKAVWARRQEDHSDVHKECLSGQGRIDTKKGGVRDRERELASRRPGIQAATQELDAFEKSVIEFEQRVQELERQLAQYQEPMDQALGDLQEGEQQLDEAIELRSPMKDRSLSITSP